MEYQKEMDEKITITISGTAMDANLGYELRYLMNFLTSIENQIEKTYLFSYDKTRMSEEDYQNLKVIMSKTRVRSFEADIFIQLQQTVIALIPLLANDGQAIWEIIKKSYEYLKLVIDTRKEGKEVEITQDGDGIIVTGNNNNITINKHVPALSKDLSPSFSKMANNIDGDKIKQVNFSSTKDSDIELTEEDKERFKSKTLLFEETVTVDGEIVASDFERYRGNIKVFPDQELPSEIFSFEVANEIKDKQIFKNSYLSNVRVKCQQRVKIDPTKEEMTETIGLKILDIELI